MKKNKGHYTIDGMVFPGACILGLLVICIIAGCTGNASSSGIATDPAAASRVPVSANDVIIPVSTDSSITFSSVMLKDGGTPSNVYEKLVTKDLNGNFRPTLAKNWTVSDDAKTWTFHLQEAATWSDGVPFTCEDVKFTNDYMKEKNLTLGFVLNDIQSVDCPDPYTAVVTLRTSYSGFLDQISHTPGITISPRHVWQNITDPQHYVDKAFVGTGPFVYVKNEPGYVLEKTNTGYYGKVPAISGVVYQVITNPDSQVLALRSGEIDVVSGLKPAVAASLAGEKNITVYTIHNTGTYEMAFNLKQYPANITGFRKAMSHAVDRKTISSLMGTGTPTDTTFLVPDLAGDYVNPADIGMYNYNLTLAEEELAAAGFKKNSAGTLEGPDGEPVTIMIPYWSEGGSGAHNAGVKTSPGGSQAIITVFQNDWKKLGITVSTVSYDDKSQYRTAVKQNPVFIDSFPVQLHDNANALLNFAVTPAQETNLYNYNNPEFNSLVDEMKNTADPAEIRALGYRMQDLLAQDVPTIPICTTDTLVAYRNDRFTGWDIGPGYHSVTDPLVLANLTPVKTQ